MKVIVVTVTCHVEIAVNDPEAITCVTGPNGDEWRSHFYNLRTEHDVLEHFAYNRIVNGCENVSSLDGWAGLPADAVTMKIKTEGFEVQEVRRENLR